MYSVANIGQRNKAYLVYCSQHKVEFNSKPNYVGEHKLGMAFASTRQMYDVDLTCASCGAHISQLPFQPSGDRPVYCADCNRNYRDRNRGGQSDNRRAPRQMYQVNVACATCGTQITELPFQPSGDKPVYCRSCMMARRNGDN